ncbi:hypothetical protein Tco_0960289 [Tanacetum coccineum]
MAEDFSKTPSIVYQNYLREFWCTTEVVDLNPPTDDSEARPLKELSIKFNVKNDTTPLLLNYQTLCQTTRLEYNNRIYMANPFTEEVKAKLAKIATHDHCTYAQDVEGNKQPTVKGLPSTPDKGIHSSKPLLEGKPTDAKDLEGNTQLDGIGSRATHPDKGTRKTKALLKGTNIDPKYLGRNIQLTDRGQPLALVTDLSGTSIKDQEKSPSLHISLKLSPKALKQPKNPKKRRVRKTQLEPEPLHQHSDSESSAGSLILEDNWVKHEEAAASYAYLKATVEGFAAEADNNRNNFDIAINSVMESGEQINGARVEEHNSLLKALNRVSETLEADFALKATMQKMADTNTSTSGNITNLTKLLRNANLPEILTQLNAFQTSLNSFSS